MDETRRAGISGAWRRWPARYVLAVILSVIATAGQSVPSGAAPPAESPVAPPAPPPNAPIVRYEHGLLTISASNTSLQDILTEIHRCTGAVIEFPPQAAAASVFTRLGPGPARAVVSALLLESPQFDYLVIGRDTDPDALAQVLLFSKEAAGKPSRPLLVLGGTPVAGTGPPAANTPTPRARALQQIREVRREMIRGRPEPQAE